MSLTEFEEPFREALREQHHQLQKLYDRIRAQGRLDLDGHEISKAVVFRMKAYYEVQNEIKHLLNKGKLPAAADFFVEAVCFYLKALVDTHGIGVEVCSERPIERGRYALRPDISIWKGDRVAAMIECKT